MGRSCLQPELRYAGAGRSARGARRRPMGAASTGWLGLAQAGERLKADLPAGRRGVAGRSRRLRCEWRGDLELSSVRRRPWADAGRRVAAASPPGGAPCEGVVPLIPADARPCMERATRDHCSRAARRLCLRRGVEPSVHRIMLQYGYG